MSVVASEARDEAGFTLIELLVVIVVIALLMAVSLPAFLGQQRKAEDAAAKQYLTTAWKAELNASAARGFFAAPRQVAKEIQRSDSELKPVVVSGSSRVSSLGSEKNIGVSAASTAKRLVLYSHSQSGTDWQLSYRQGWPGSQISKVGAPQAPPGPEKPKSPPKPFPWHTLIIVLGIVLGALLLVLLSTWTTIRLVRKRTVKRLTAAALKEWRRYVEEPGVDGPFTPEEGYELLVPEKREEIDAQNARVEIEFIIALYRFAEGRWQQLDDEVTTADLEHKTKSGRAAQADERKRKVWQRVLGVAKPSSALPTLPEFERLEAGLTLRWAADTPIDELAAAWFDFQERVKTQNRMKWAQMENERIEDEARKRELERQLKTAELLSGTTNYDELATKLRKLEKVGKGTSASSGAAASAASAPADSADSAPASAAAGEE